MKRMGTRSSDGSRKRLHARASTRATAPVARPTPRAQALGSGDGIAPFRAECQAALRSLCKAVRTLAADVDIDPLKPQDVARRLKLNKNLTWKFARILLAEDCMDAIPMVPGPEGIDIFARGFERMKAPAGHIDALRDAAKEFDDVVERHFGTRAELEFALDGLRADGNLEQPRRMAFRGASGVFGVQAAARVVAHFVVPTAEDPTLGDLALIAGLSGLRRLRPMPKLPVFRAVRNGSLDSVRRPLIAGAEGDEDNFLLAKYTSVPHGEVTSTSKDGRLSVELGGGPVGRIGDADLFFGTLAPKAFNLVRRPPDLVNELVTSVSIPCESLVCDLFVHRSIHGLDSIRASMHATLSGPLPLDEDLREVVRLPIQCEPVAIEDFERAMQLPRVARYGEIIRDALAALGRDASEFHIFRVALDYPPMPSALLVRWDLSENPPTI